MLLHNRASYHETLLLPDPLHVAKFASGKIFPVLLHLLRNARIFSVGPVTSRAYARDDHTCDL